MVQTQVLASPKYQKIYSPRLPALLLHQYPSPTAQRLIDQRSRQTGVFLVDVCLLCMHIYHVSPPLAVICTIHLTAKDGGTYIQSARSGRGLAALPASPQICTISCLFGSAPRRALSPIGSREGEEQVAQILDPCRWKCVGLSCGKSRRFQGLSCFCSSSLLLMGNK